MASAEDVRRMNVDKLCQWLKPKLDDEDWNDVEQVIRGQLIMGSNFLNYTKADWKADGLPGGIADSLLQIAQGVEYKASTEDVRRMTSAELCKWLKPKLADEQWNVAEQVIRKQLIMGNNFLNTTIERWMAVGLPLGVAMSLVRIAQGVPKDGVESETQARKKRKLNYIQLAPSSFANQWHEYLGLSTNYLIGRVNRRFRLPVQLLCPVFGQFVHRFHKYEARKSVSSRVDELCNEMEQRFARERERNEEFHRIFRDIIGRNIFFSQIERSGVTSDGSIIHPFTNCVILNLETKKEMGHSGDAFMENLQYFVYFLEDKASRACRPCFLVELVGPNICVSGALVAEDHFVCDRLTPMLSLVRTGIRSEFYQLCSLFSALAQGIEDIVAFYDNGLHNAIVDSTIPFPSFFENLSLENVQHLTRFVFEATLDSRPVVVKFTETYCMELHELLAAHNMAPKILKVSEAPPFWKIIVMEYLDIKPVCSLRQHAQDISVSVSNILKLMRENQFVHGDFRSINVFGVLIQGEFSGQVVVIDFDWSGRHGVAKYPDQMNNEISWPQGCEAGALLDYTHDEAWATSFFQ